MLELRGFYENELTNDILPFWMERCLDAEHGGYFNCYDNAGVRLMSRDKYTWSQGRFVWMFARLSQMERLFRRGERERFLGYAKSGADFLMEHCLLPGEPLRCAFLMDETGAPKKTSGWDDLDMSIYADCFVICGLSRYAAAAGDEKAYGFASRLYASCLERLASGGFKTLPYPLSPGFRAHGIPMIFSNVAMELSRAARAFGDGREARLELDAHGFSSTVLTDFADENDVIHEVIKDDGSFFGGLLGEHSNPGHTLEDMWFVADAADACGDGTMAEKAARCAKKALETGWDEELGGLLHFASVHGGVPDAPAAGYDGEPTVKLVQGGWGDKLWWVHSEALYTTLLFYLRTGDAEFLRWHDRVFGYVFSHFPNKDREVREWIQILKRDGSPQDKVVALPVKDPYHITRDLTLIIDLLDAALNETP